MIGSKPGRKVNNMPSSDALCRTDQTQRSKELDGKNLRIPSLHTIYSESTILIMSIPYCTSIHLEVYMPHQPVFNQALTLSFALPVLTCVEVYPSLADFTVSSLSKRLRLHNVQSIVWIVSSWVFRRTRTSKGQITSRNFLDKIKVCTSYALRGGTDKEEATARFVP